MHRRYGNVKCEDCERFVGGRYVVPHCRFETGRTAFDPVRGTIRNEIRLIPVVFTHEYPNRNGDCKAFTPKEPAGERKVTLLSKIRRLLCIKSG